jgi:nitronate monooxygenase
MFLVSGPELVKAACASGVVGTFPALNQRESSGFEDWLRDISVFVEGDRKARPGQKVAPYGVNLIVHPSNPRLEVDLGLCVQYQVPLVITSLGAASRVVDAVHGYGGVVFHDVANLKHARKAADAGVDGIIAVAGGAGGHAGTLNPFALVAEIRSFFSGTLLLAGALSRGDDILAAQAMGADLAYMGTRFISTVESRAGEAYKQMILEATAEDIVYTPAVSGVPASFMRQSLLEAGYDMDRLMQAGDVNFGEKLKPVASEARAWKTVWSAGHGVSAIQDVPTTAALVDRLAEEYRAARQRLG